MNNTVFDVVIIGAGHAGLSLSYHLARFGLKHIVLERGSIGESWRNQRWNSFRLNTTNNLNLLPGDTALSHDANRFPTATEFADHLKAYVSRYQLPVVENSLVSAVSKDDDTGIFRVVVKDRSGQNKYYARQVVVASGSQNEIKIPDMSADINKSIWQLHASQFRADNQLPAGAVLVVGSAQSGCQIAEDLADAGRKVYLSTSMVSRLPRRYRGKDIIEWLIATGFFEVPVEQVKDPKVFRSTAPQLTGVSGRTISLQSLASRGVVILGRMSSAKGSIIRLEPNAAAHVKFADEGSKNLKNMIDDFIEKKNLQAPAAEIDANDLPDINATCASDITSLDLDATGISSIIWATGFGNDHRYLLPLVAGGNETPGHVNGISHVDGLYFLGLPWLRKRKSGLICGASEDAEFIAEQVFNRWKFFRIRREVMNYE